MNKYLLPSIIIVGLIVVFGYYQLNKNENETINKTITSTITPGINRDEVISASPTSTSSSVPLPTGEDIVRTFFNLINEKKIPEAISMMTSAMTGDESSKQAWGVNFNSINSVSPKTIQPYNQSEWNNNKQTYRVTINMSMNPSSANAPIPYYGWDNGENIRWVVIEKENNLWKVSSINTGP